MITVKIEMWPGGSEKCKREIGRMYIANVGGTADRGDYMAAVCRRGSVVVPQPINPKGPKPTRSGSVLNYPRLAYNVWRLVCRALRDAFPEEDRATRWDDEQDPVKPDEDSIAEAGR